VTTPIEAHVSMVGENEYSMLVLEPLTLFHGCPLVGLCAYAAEEVHIDAHNDGEGHIVALAEEEPLTRHSGSVFCPGSGEWDAEYLVKVLCEDEESYLDAWLALHFKEEA
jgi:hypothetical protein